MNRNTFISLSVIGVLLLAIILTQTIKPSTAPNLTEIREDVDSLVIKDTNRSLTIKKKDDKWVLGDKGYPAEKGKVSRMVKSLKELKLSATISRRRYYDPYDLQPGKALQVTASSDGKVVRELWVGKSAARGRKTYIRLRQRPEVFLADGALQRTFGQSVEQLRDRTLFSLDRKTIQTIKIACKGRPFTVVKELIPAAKKDDKQKDNKKDQKQPAKNTSGEKWKVQGQPNVELDKKKLDQFVGAFANFRADGFPKQDTKPERIACSIEIRALGRSLTLKIGEQQKDKKYLCSSSASPFPFLIAEWRAQRVMQSLSDLQKK